ncbi:hypothetical protein ACA910_019226 [Epithemia clementina (nom. ined.)]
MRTATKYYNFQDPDYSLDSRWFSGRLLLRLAKQDRRRRNSQHWTILAAAASSTTTTRRSTAPAPSSTKASKLFPFQQEGVQFLVTQERVLLADEMGLGKTVQCLQALNEIAYHHQEHQINNKNNNNIDDGSIGGGTTTTATTLRVLIVCPKSILGVWEGELEKWMEFPYQVEILSASGSKDFQYDHNDEGMFASAHGGHDTQVQFAFTLINYDLCPKYQDTLQQRRQKRRGDDDHYYYDVMICDEAHYLKSIQSQRTLAVLGNGRKSHPGISSRYLWLLTGTPMLNRPVELYPLLRAIFNDGPSTTATASTTQPSKRLQNIKLESFTAFTNKYCDAQSVHFGQGSYRRIYTGCSNLVELKKRWLEPIMLRRRKSQVLTELPPKLRSCVCLTNTTDVARQERERFSALLWKEQSDFVRRRLQEAEESRLPTASTTKKVIQTVNQDLSTFGSQASEDVSDYLGNFSYPEFLKTMKVDTGELSNLLPASAFQACVLGAMASVRKETAMSKLNPALELLDDILLTETKVVVFAHHRELMDGLLEHLGDRAVCVRGGMSNEHRRDAVHRFQTDPHVSVFVGSIRAAGEGLTLTAASHVIFLDLDWSPGKMAQAEDRCHRVGQHDCVQVEYYVFKDTIDEWIVKTILDKQEIIDKVIEQTTGAAPNEMTKTIQTKRPGPLLYVFDFGKFTGCAFDDVPKSYIQFLVQQEKVWRSRPDLKTALVLRGLIVEDAEPPSRPLMNNGNKAADKAPRANSGKDFASKPMWQNTRQRRTSPVVDNNARPTSHGSTPQDDGYNFNLIVEDAEPPSRPLMNNGNKAADKASRANSGKDFASKPMWQNTRQRRPSPVVENNARPTSHGSTPQDDGYNFNLIVEDAEPPSRPLMNNGNKAADKASRANSGKNFASKPMWQNTRQRRPSPVVDNNARPASHGSKPQDDGYNFNFGKHRGLSWEKTPQYYRNWIIRQQVWKTRPDLREFLDRAGYI